jgi:hypothetical protein
LVASDEKAYDGGDVQRPMTIAELCRKGALKGFATTRRYRRLTLADYSNRVWVGAFASLPIAFLATPDLRATAMVFVALSLSWLMFWQSVVARRNYQMWNTINGLKENPLALLVESDRLIWHMIKAPVAATFYQFDGDMPRYGQLSARSINRSDGDGNQIVFMVFADDHDRVMFRLSI